MTLRLSSAECQRAWDAYEYRRSPEYRRRRDRWKAILILGGAIAFFAILGLVSKVAL